MVNTVFDYPLSVAGFESGTEIVLIFFFYILYFTYITTCITIALLWLASTPTADLYYQLFFFKYIHK